MNDILESAIHDAMISLYTGFRFQKWGWLFIINHFQNLESYSINTFRMQL